jgi:hypothetical protein
MRIRTAVPLLSIALLGVCSGAGYSTNFNSGFNNAQAVAGQDGWTINDSTPDLSFFASYNFTDAAALGGYYDDPALTNVTLSHGASLPLVQTSLGMDFAIVPSTVSFPGQDAFGWSFFNALGNNLLSIQFEPDNIDPTLLNVTWTTGAGAATSTVLAIEYNGPYKLNVDFTTLGGSNAGFTASITSSNSVSFNGTLPGLAGETVASFGQNFVKKGASAGDNYMIIDNLAVVPEPSTGLMVLAALAIPLTVRRRKSAAR